LEEEETEEEKEEVEEEKKLHQPTLKELPLRCGAFLFYLLALVISVLTMLVVGLMVVA
jgi:hypothetical protein